MKIQRKAFTLIELLVVVLIIGLLSMIATPKFIRSVEESRSTEATTTLSTYATAQGRRFVQAGSYTTQLSDLDIGFIGLEYFTVTKIGQTMTLTRKVNAGGDLGQWSVSISLPNIPGLGANTWTCTPMPACKYLIPSNQAGGAVSSANE